MEYIVTYLIVAVLVVAYIYRLLKVDSESTGAAPPDVMKWESFAKKQASNYGLPWQVVLAQIWQESGGNPSARGAAGEIGLMQVKPIAVEGLHRNGYGGFSGWKDNPGQNIKAGTAYLHLQRTRTGTMYDAVGETAADSLEAYNEGYSQAKKDFEQDEYSRKVMQKAQILGYDK